MTTEELRLYGSLADYIHAYLMEEFDRDMEHNSTLQHPERLQTHMLWAKFIANLRENIDNAIDAYEGGAR